MKPELTKIFVDDRAEDRGVIAGTPAYAALRARDASRRRSVAEILENERSLEPDDLYHAAWILNHGDLTEEAERAHHLALAAAKRGHKPARWLAAAALDRSLMYQGLPQRFGTQIVPDGKRWRLWDLVQETTDADRAQWDVPPLAEMNRRAEEVSRDGEMPPLDEAPDWLKSALVRWSQNPV